MQRASAKVIDRFKNGFGKPSKPIIKPNIIKLPSPNTYPPKLGNLSPINSFTCLSVKLTSISAIFNIPFGFFKGSAFLALKPIIKDKIIIISIASNAVINSPGNMKTNDEWIQVKIDRAWQDRLKYTQPRERFSRDPYINIRIVKNNYDIYRNGKQESVNLIYFTNLSREEFDSKDIMHLYSKRWVIETGYKTLKTDLEWERYFSKDCDSETCSIYAKVVFHNLAEFYVKRWMKN